MTAIDIGSTYSFTPTASDPDGDALTFSVKNQPSWADFDKTTGSLSGQPALGSVGTYASIEISVSDGKGYKIYWGTTPGQYTHSVKIENAGMSSYVVENLTPGTYEFAATSFNDAGVESAYSNPATRVLN
jgi:hypothetical protein